jgi:hypothetical protein
VHSQSALAWARGDSGQINTTVTQFTRPHLDALYDVLCQQPAGAARSLFP